MKEEFPTIIVQAQNLIQSATEVAKSVINNEGVLVPKKVKKERLEVCANCRYLHKHKGSNDKKKWQCMSCGCFVNIKSSFACQECPKGYWSTWSNSDI